MVLENVVRYNQYTARFYKVKEGFKYASYIINVCHLRIW